MTDKKISRLMWSIWLLAAAGALLPGRAVAQGQVTPKPAEAHSIMDTAYKQAKSAKKPVLVIFGATW